MSRLPISVLELAPVLKGESIKNAIDNTVAVAQKVESLDFNRLWIAEHHNMEYIASSATSVLIGHVASQTKEIRVGSGGIMIPNHAPLVVAEQFGTLETIYPGRIDLGLGRAPGTDQRTAMALRRNNLHTHFYFKDDVETLQQLFSKDNSGANVRAFPGDGLEVPIWILGSSTDSALLAAEMGLPYSFAAHFAPTQLKRAAELYRENFKPSKQLDKPYFMPCINVIGAETTEDAEFLKTSLLNLFTGVVTNNRYPLAPPTKNLIYKGIPQLENAINNMLSCTFVGDTNKLKVDLNEFVDKYQADELMVVSYIYDFEKKLRSFEILKEALK